MTDLPKLPPLPAESPNEREVPLPSGRFARVRRIRYLDVLISALRAHQMVEKYKALPPEDERRELVVQQLHALTLMARITVIDDKPVTPEELLHMDSRDVNVIDKLIGSFVGPMFSS